MNEQHNVVSIQSSGTNLETARIKFIQNTHCVLQSDQGIHHAQVAASCLLTPAIGDLVLICKNSDSTFVLSILQQATENAKIAISGDLDISVKGQVSISARSDLNLMTESTLQQSAKKLEQTSQHHSITAEQFNLSTLKAAMSTKEAQVHAQQCHCFIDRVYQKADQVMRWVETIETAHIGNLVQSIKHTWNARSRQTIITAKEDVKVDAQRIHMG